MASNTKGKKPLSQEQIISGFQELRQRQRNYASKLSELEMERRDHDLVIETLKEVELSRKCFRLVGGVLVERTVKEVLAALQHDVVQLTTVIENMKKQLETTGVELNTYREKHGLRIQGEEKKEEKKPEEKGSSTGVLVAS